jgi:hypothetical protein
MKWLISLVSVASATLVQREAAAEFSLVKQDGWELSLDGRLNTFVSVSYGDQQPNGIPTWSGGLEDRDVGSGTIMMTRVRSAFMMNSIGFNMVKQLSPDLKVTGRFSVWAGVSQERSKTDSPALDARELYIKLEGPWGGLLAGRALGLFERGPILMDYDLVHGTGLGNPCTVRTVQGGACGFAGHGLLFPNFSAGVVYNTPNLAGFQVSVGAYDPVAITERQYEVTPLPRIEAEATYNLEGHFKLFADLLWQRLSNNEPLKDDMQMPILDTNGKPKKQTVDANGVSFGGQFTLGPFSAGGAFYTGKGLGLLIPMFNTPLFSDEKKVLRTSQGYVGMASLTFGGTKIGGGAGVSQLKMTSTEQEPFTALDIPKQQLGIGIGLYQTFYKQLTWALEYFRGQYTWYDYQASDGTVSTPTQNVNFVNTGLTLMY